MHIQYIGLRKQKFISSNIDCSDINNPKDFDDFDFNVIDLASENIWEDLPTKPMVRHTNYFSDFNTLKAMIASTSSKVLIILPKNSIGLYKIKDFMDGLESRLLELYPFHLELLFGITKTKLNEVEISSDFVFPKLIENFKIITKSVKGSKPTTITDGKVTLTTINISNSDILKQFMIETKVIQVESPEMPKWMEEVNMFDDINQLDTIQLTEQEIQELENKIAKAQEKLNENKRLKSILYTQNETLVEVVFEIFQELLGVDLSRFEDKKIEDISFSIGEKTFIGEIKGISSNVKTTNLSQLDNHYTNFVEEHPEIPEESIYKLLIINHQRRKALRERDPIDHKQIEIAKNKYTSLIIETSELLKALEKYRDKLISRDEIIDLLTKNGLFEIE